MCGHFLDQADGRRTAKDPRRDAAAERRVDIEIMIASFSLVASPRPEAAARVTCVRRFFCGPERASAVCERRKKPFNANTRAWGRLCAQLFVSAELVHFPRERHHFNDLVGMCDITLWQWTTRWTSPSGIFTPKSVELISLCSDPPSHPPT